MISRKPEADVRIRGWLIPGLLVILLLTSMTDLSWAGPGKSLRRAEMLDRLDNTGEVKVMVRIKIPEFRKLRDASRQYGVVNPLEKDLSGLPRQARAADAALAHGIGRMADKVLQRMAAIRFRLNHRFETLPYVALTVSREALLELESDPNVEYIVIDRPRPLPRPVSASNRDSNGVWLEKGWRDAGDAVTAPEPPSLSDSLDIIGAKKAWAKGYTGQGWYVAILDTGIRRTHEFFQSKNIVEACYSVPGHCPNGLNSMTGTGAATHYSNTYAGYDHGTHVAGISAGHKSDDTLNGVAKSANILAINVFSRFSGSACSPDEYCVMAYNSDIVKGLEHVYSLRNTYSIASVNLSLGGGKYGDQTLCDSENSAEREAIDNLRQVNIATAAASGNSGYCDGIDAPACVTPALAVGAVDKSDREASFNSWHRTLMDIWAPGVSILSSTGDSNSSYQAWSGTSMATPHMAGAWAILRQARPNDTVSTIFTDVANTSPAVGTICSTGGSKPRLRIDGALTASEFRVRGYLRLNGLPLKGAVVRFVSGGATQTATTNANGYYARTLPKGWSGTVRPVKTCYGFTPFSRSIDNLSANQRLDFTWRRLSRVYGYVLKDGQGLAGVSMNLSGSKVSTLTNNRGYYLLKTPCRYKGRVSATKLGYQTTPESAAVSEVTNATRVDFKAAARKITVQGTVLYGGRRVAGVKVTFSNGGGEAITDSTGVYRKRLPYGWSGRVTPSINCRYFSPAWVNLRSVKVNTTRDFKALRGVQVRGRVTEGGKGLSLVTLAFTSQGTARTNTGGYYVKTLPCGWSGKVIPRKAGYTMSPVSVSKTKLRESRTTVYFSAVKD